MSTFVGSFNTEVSLIMMVSIYGMKTNLPNHFKQVDTTLVKGDPMAPFSIATTPRCWGVLLHSLDCSTLPLILIL